MNKQQTIDQITKEVKTINGLTDSHTLDYYTGKKDAYRHALALLQSTDDFQDKGPALYAIIAAKRDRLNALAGPYNVLSWALERFDEIGITPPPDENDAKIKEYVAGLSKGDTVFIRDNGLRIGRIDDVGPFIIVDEAAYSSATLKHANSDYRSIEIPTPEIIQEWADAQIAKLEEE